MITADPIVGAEATPDEHAPVGLNRHRIDKAVRPRARIKAQVQRSVRVHPRYKVARHGVHGVETPTNHRQSIRLDSHRQHRIIRPRIRVLRRLGLVFVIRVVCDVHRPCDPSAIRIDNDEDGLITHILVIPRHPPRNRRRIHTVLHIVEPQLDLFVKLGDISRIDSKEVDRSDRGSGAEYLHRNKIVGRGWVQPRQQRRVLGHPQVHLISSWPRGASSGDAIPMHREEAVCLDLLHSIYLAGKLHATARARRRSNKFISKWEERLDIHPRRSQCPQRRSDG